MNVRTKEIISWSVCLLLLIGMTFSGQSDILCIGEDGRVEFESICLPCCTVSDTVCDNKLSKGQHEEHTSCSDCSDVDPGTHQWANCRREIGPDQFTSAKVVSPVYATQDILTVDQNGLSLLKLHKMFKQSDSGSVLSVISTTVIRC